MSGPRRTRDYRENPSKGIESLQHISTLGRVYSIQGGRDETYWMWNSRRKLGVLNLLYLYYETITQNGINI